MKFAYFGTSEFSKAILERLISDFYRPELIVTQPSKPVGRKQELQDPAVVHVAKSHNIKCVQPEKLSEIESELKKLDLDLIIVASYGKIIPQSVLDIPKLGAVNVHTSLLPKYRGASPIHAAVLNGDDVTGVTIMKMDEKLDHGPIIYQKSIKLSPRETTSTLEVKLANLGADVLAKIIGDFVKGKLKVKEQDHEKATFSGIIKKEDAKIDWTKPANEIDQIIRAYESWPTAWTVLPDGKRLKIYEALPFDHETEEQYKPGEIIIYEGQTYIGTGTAPIEIDLLQVEGKNKQTGKDFARGYSQFDKQVLI